MWGIVAPEVGIDKGVNLTKMAAQEPLQDLEPTPDRIPSEEVDVHVVNPSGFIWKDGQAARTTGTKVNVDGLAFEDKDSNAFITTVEHSN